MIKGFAFAKKYSCIITLIY